MGMMPLQYSQQTDHRLSNHLKTFQPVLVDHGNRHWSPRRIAPQNAVDHGNRQWSLRRIAPQNAVDHGNRQWSLYIHLTAKFTEISQLHYIMAGKCALFDFFHQSIQNNKVCTCAHEMGMHDTRAASYHLCVCGKTMRKKGASRPVHATISCKCAELQNHMKM